MNIISAKNPRWLNADSTEIELLVTFEHCGEVPFTASPTDTEEHGRVIFAKAAAGHYGAVAPYVAPVPVPPTPEELLEQAKKERMAAVAAIKVTTASGKVFDGDETSQTRMARAIIALEAMGAPSVKWVLANNVPTDVTVAELTEALALAGAAQAAVWSAPYGVA